LIIIIFAAASAFYFKLVVITPNVCGLSYQKSLEVLKAVNLNASVKNPENNYASKIVKAQYPKPGIPVKAKSKINLYLLEEDLLRVPYLIKTGKIEAASILKDFKLTAKFEPKPSLKPKNSITSQDPPPGTPVNEQDVINLTVSQGFIGLEIPDLVGKSLDEARQIAAPMGLNLLIKGKNTNPQAQIVRQEPRAGEAVLNNEIQVICEQTLVVPGRGISAIMRCNTPLLLLPICRASSRWETWKMILGSPWIPAGARLLTAP